MNRADMMKAIRAAWESGSNAKCARIWMHSDGYGVPGLIPPQGYDWSGIRDSSDEAVQRMFDVIKPFTEDEVRVGQTFATLLQNEIGVERLQVVRKRNRKHRADGCCASHDFCDANMVMAEALAQCGFVERQADGEADIDPDDDVINLLWNRAWDYAKEHHLTEQGRG